MLFVCPPPSLLRSQSPQRPPPLRLLLCRASFSASPQIAVEGCGHGELDKIYETMQYLERTEGKKIDLLICCGDFQVGGARRLLPAIARCSVALAGLQAACLHACCGAGIAGRSSTQQPQQQLCPHLPAGRAQHG